MVGLAKFLLPPTGPKQADATASASDLKETEPRSSYELL